MAAHPVEHVVADAGAFLKKASLQDIGTNIYTLRDVVDEIRDKPTRRSLAFLPYKLNFKEPTSENIRHVTEFSKKTGDFPSLSATDIKVLALTYQLELEHVGSLHLRREPERKINIQSTRRHPETPVNMAGFHFPSKKPADALSCRQTPPETSSSSAPDPDQFNTFNFWKTPLPPLDSELLHLLESPNSDMCREAGHCERQRSSGPCAAQDEGGKLEEHKPQTQTSAPTSDADKFSTFQFWREPVLTLDDDLLELVNMNGSSKSKSGADAAPTLNQSDEDKENEPEEEAEPEEEEEDDDDDDDDDGGGWITPSNIQQVKMDSGDWTAPAHVRVGCLTTDFAMQNVLIQMGLHVLSINGLLIKQARNYILRCHACFKTTSNMEKVFCPHCGNKTLKKLAVTINQDGSVRMHFSSNPKVLNARGLRHSLPMPQGGKHGSNPHLVEDQVFPQQRLSRKARQKNDVFNPDYLARSSPFCENDIYSRAANLQLRDGQCGGGRRRANPNCSRKKFVKKK